MGSDSDETRACDPSSAEDDSRLAEAFTEYVDRLNAGEEIDREEVAAAYPDLAPRLLRKIEIFRSLHDSREEAAALGALGEYRLVRRIGRGGMGVVYEAWQTTLERKVAVKVLPGGLLADLKAVARFEREAKIAGRVQHPNVVGVLGLGVDRNIPYYAMEFVLGETLLALRS